MLDDQDRIPPPDDPVERCQKLLYVLKVESSGGFIKYVELGATVSRF